MAQEAERSKIGDQCLVFLCPTCGAYLVETVTGPRLEVGQWIVSGVGDDADWGFLYGTAGDLLAVSWFGSMTGGTVAADDAEPVTFKDQDDARAEFLERFNAGRW